MKSILQLALERIDESGDMEFQIRSYSGRYMFGRECLAIVPENNADIFMLGILLGNTVDDDEIDLHQLLIDAANAQTDSLGRSIVYYWPNVPFITEEDE